MNSAMISAKQFQIAIKNGLIPEELAEKHGVTVEELKIQLKHLYNAGDGSKAQSIFGQLEANKKKSRKKKKKPANTVIEQPNVEQEAQPEEPKSKTLSDLQEEEGNLSSEVIQLETEHKELSSRHRACNTELRKLQELMAQFERQLDDCKSRFDSIANSADAIAVQMNGISDLRKEKLVVLERVRQEIEERSRITLFVTSDGVIEAPENPDFVINDEGFQEIKAEIAEREECLDLRVRDVTTLARLLKICEEVDHVELICDHAELENAFKAIRQ